MAVACGNTVVLKSSELCPGTNYLITKAVAEGTLPPGVLNLVSHAAEDAAKLCKSGRASGSAAHQLHGIERRREHHRAPGRRVARAGAARTRWQIAYRLIGRREHRRRRGRGNLRLFHASEAYLHGDRPRDRCRRNRGYVRRALRSVANDTEYGLSGALFSQNINRALAVSRRIESGICHINGPTIQDEARIPFGNGKASGHGRFGGRGGVESFTYSRWITVETQEPHYAFSSTLRGPKPFIGVGTCIANRM